MACCASERPRDIHGRKTKELRGSLGSQQEVEAARSEQFKRAAKLHLEAVFGIDNSDREVYRDFAKRYRRTASDVQVKEDVP